MGNESFKYITYWFYKEKIQLFLEIADVANLELPMVLAAEGLYAFLKRALVHVALVPKWGLHQRTHIITRTKTTMY